MENMPMLIGTLVETADIILINKVEYLQVAELDRIEEEVRELNDRSPLFRLPAGLKSALCFTPNDNREMHRPPKCATANIGTGWWTAWTARAHHQAGRMVSIESTGGKEIYDEAPVKYEIERVIFALRSWLPATRPLRTSFSHSRMVPKAVST